MLRVGAEGRHDDVASEVIIKLTLVLIKRNARWQVASDRGGRGGGDEAVRTPPA